MEQKRAGVSIVTTVFKSIGSGIAAASCTKRRFPSFGRHLAHKAAKHAYGQGPIEYREEERNVYGKFRTAKAAGEMNHRSDRRLYCNLYEYAAYRSTGSDRGRYDQPDLSIDPWLDFCLGFGCAAASAGKAFFPAL